MAGYDGFEACTIPKTARERCAGGNPADIPRSGWTQGRSRRVIPGLYYYDRVGWNSGGLGIMDNGAQCFGGDVIRAVSTRAARSAPSTSPCFPRPRASRPEAALLPLNRRKAVASSIRSLDYSDVTRDRVSSPDRSRSGTAPREISSGGATHELGRCRSSPRDANASRARRLDGVLRVSSTLRAKRPNRSGPPRVCPPPPPPFPPPPPPPDDAGTPLPGPREGGRSALFRTRGATVLPRALPPLHQRHPGGRPPVQPCEA